MFEALTLDDVARFIDTQRASPTFSAQVFEMLLLLLLLF
jgi:hypothetical protein